MHAWQHWWSNVWASALGTERPAPADPEHNPAHNLVVAQGRAWEHFVDANRVWWQVYLASLPKMPWPPAGMLAPPAESAEPAAPAALPVAAPASKPLPRAQRHGRAASGPAAVRVKHQRKR